MIRDEAQSKMLALKEKADKELTQYNTELKELIRVIDHDRKLKEFMRRKDHERTEAHEEMEMTRRKRGGYWKPILGGRAYCSTLCRG